MEEIKKYRSLEEVAITVKEAVSEDLSGIENFLGRHEIDSLFIPSLSDPVRGMTIKERVERKFNNGKWIIAMREKKVVGCMAIVPAKLTKEIQPTSKESHISLGVSLEGWNKNRFWELSTVVVDLDLVRREKIKGIGGTLFEVAKNWVRTKGSQNGLVTDSWIGGDMGGFITVMNTREFRLQHSDTESTRVPDTLMRIYSDIAKRGENGPPTVIYGIPLDDPDWIFFESKQAEIEKLKKEYERLEKSL